LPILPRVSVVVPAYEPEGFLLETVASVRAQTFSEWELIVVDDGSKRPESLKLLAEVESAGDERVRVIRQENRGLPGARNRGFEEARAEYVVPVDADDLLEPEMLAACLEALEARPEAGFAYFDFRVFGDRHYSERPGEINLYRLLDENPLSHCLMVRREVWDQVGRYDEAQTWGYEDWSFYIALVKNGFRGTYVRRPLFRYRKHGESFIDRARERHEQIRAHMAERHADVMSPEGRLQVKRQWSPSVCVVAASGASPDLSNQTLQDYQLLRTNRETEALERSPAEAFLWMEGGGRLRPQALEEALLGLQDADWVTWRDTGDAPPPSFQRAAGPLGVKRQFLGAADPKPSGIVRRLPWRCRIGEAEANTPEAAEEPATPVAVVPPSAPTEVAWLERVHRHLTNAELLDAETWRRSPVGALARLIPLRIKEAVNERFGRPVFDLSFYLKFQPRSVSVDGQVLEPLDYLTRPSEPGRKRVGLVTPHLGYGGAETVLLEMARQLDRAECEVLLFAPHSEDSRLLDEWRGAVDHVYDLAQLGPLESAAGRLLSLALAWRLDVLAVQNSPVGYSIVPALKNARPEMRVADVLHIVDPEWDLFEATVDVAEWIDRRIVISEQGRKRLVEMATPEERMRLIPNGVDLQIFDPQRYHSAGLKLSLNVEEASLVVAFVARLVEMKRPLLLAAIARELRSLAPEREVVFAVAGTGPLETALRQRIARDGVGDSFRLLGHLAKPAELLAAADLLVMPSESEGVPLALLEGLAMGVPVVASRAGAIEEELTEDLGVLVEPGPDEERRFAEAILELAADAERRERMSRAGVAAASEKHSLERARGAYRELWAELLDSAGW